MTFDLTKSREQQPAPAGAIGQDPRYPDYELMLHLFHGGETCRAVALDMADRNREAARPTSKREEAA